MTTDSDTTPAETDASVVDPLAGHGAAQPYIDQLIALSNPEKAAQMRAYHKVDRPYLGLSNPEVNDLVKTWRTARDLPDRVALARALWTSDIFEARLAAAKLLTQARIAGDAEVWDLIVSWVPDFDSWAIADHACMAGQKRLVADPSRLDQVEGWTTSDHMWTRRAALVITLPWTKQNHPKADESAIRERVLGWAAQYVPDRAWFIQKAVAWWLRDLSKHDADRVRAFLAEHGAAMKPFAAKEAAKYLK
ncbi:DNA alkylation repair protein [Sulfitobacter sabulilitoris]|uniref:DNA alkylation repair protein n=1 Tax=Sulfitobacter sabulilitoris TaxID=2562655 RepID=A0A5S3PKL3_9RHOB|nr:DNA alkylation repair protein [Sulfitobacter sabulilitoris]TMM54968.1 DNA alkylation repair protein [Sulfitobacter sabulilitoris]